MAWAYRTSSYANDGAGVLVTITTGTATETVTMGTAVSAGDLLVLTYVTLHTIGSGAVTYSVSDSVNGSWGSGEVVGNNWTVAALNARTSVWSFPNSGAGTPVITITLTGTNTDKFNVGTQCAAFSGIATTTATDSTAAASGTGGSPTTGNVAPATGAANELMITAYMDAGEGTTLTAGNINGSASTLAGKHDADSGKWQGLFEYGDSGNSGGTPAGTATSTGTPSGWGILAAVFKLGAGGGGGTVIFRRRALMGVGV